MITNFPEDGVSPKCPYSSFLAVGYIPIRGEIVDGPVYISIYKNLIGLWLSKPDAFE